ncbi:MAG: dipeptide/oligopeptide/nickel ABC transporter ATP-binding protein, partial [Verrucomicrobiota bacterium]
MSLLRVENLTTIYKSGGVFSREERAVNDVSFEIDEGGTVGIAGETGCGKTTLALTMLRIRKPKMGAIYLNDRPILKMRTGRFRRLRGDMQMIYSHPDDSFRPGWNVKKLFSEVLTLHQRELSRKEKGERMMYLLESVGLSNEVAKAYPKSLNLFDRQRVSIARVLAAQPRVLICDDPTRYLDTVSQARILDILKDVQLHWKVTLLYLARDYAAVDHMSDYIHVMNRGSFVE